MLDYAVPQLYSKLKSIPVKGNEADEILRAANLNGLSKVFYEGPDNFGLVTSEGSKYVINTQAETAREVMSYLQGQHSYGTKVTWRMLEDYFKSIPTLMGMERTPTKDDQALIGGGSGVFLWPFFEPGRPTATFG
jgi:hypothetical protein